MPGSAHEVLVVALRDDPSLLSALVEALTGRPFGGDPTPIDSSVRFIEVAEVRPDLVFLRSHGPWAIVEVQNARDESKRRRWLLAASILHDQTGVLGDVFVITARRAVAAWALTVAHVESEAGTKLGLTPIVLHLGPTTLAKLLDEGKPELAFFAAWAVAHRRGPGAREIVKQAFDLAGRLPAPLREAQQRAILSVLSGHMAAALQEIAMDASKLPMTPRRRALADMFIARWNEAEERGLASGMAKGMAKGVAEGRAKGVAEGKRQALLALLGARGLAPTKAQRAAIEGCTDPATLDAWVVKAASAATVDEVLAAKPAPAPKPARARKPRSAAKSKRPRG